MSPSPLDFLEGKPRANRLLFVAEAEGKILGISGIIPKLGVDRPFYSFKRSRHARKASQHDLKVRYDTLQLTTDFDDYTELASIFLAPEARGKGVGRLLSLGRLGFIHSHRERFEDRLMADIRGWVDEDGVSPFWEHLTSKFIQTNFDEADRLSGGDAAFIVELLPALPILLNLLPDSVAECAGVRMIYRRVLWACSYLRDLKIRICAIFLTAARPFVAARTERSSRKASFRRRAAA